jgi:hypothetical protein
MNEVYFLDTCALIEIYKGNKNYEKYSQGVNLILNKMGGKLIPIIFVALTSKVFCQDLAFPKAEEEGNQPISLKNYCLQC